MNSGILAMLAACILGAMLLPFMIAYNYYFRIWWRMYQAGCPVPIPKLIRLTLRKIDAKRVAKAYVDARKAGLMLSLDELTDHYAAGGNINRVVAMLAEAHQYGGELTFGKACEYELSEEGIIEFTPGKDGKRPSREHNAG